MLRAYAFGSAIAFALTFVAGLQSTGAVAAEITPDGATPIANIVDKAGSEHQSFAKPRMRLATSTYYGNCTCTNYIQVGRVRQIDCPGYAPYQGFTRWTPKAGGTCFVCYAPDVRCPGYQGGYSSGQGQRQRNQCPASPLTASVTQALLYSVSDFYGANALCLTVDEARKKAAQPGTGVRYLNRGCEKCPPGYKGPTSFHGSRVCVRCPGRMGYRNNCCH